MSSLDTKLKDLLATQQKDGSVIPDYDGRSLPRVPQLIVSRLMKENAPAGFEHLPQPKGKEKIVLFLIDGLGYTQLTKYLPDCPFFARLADKGCLAPITSVFPTTTAAALSAVHTGLTPQEHGLLEWRIYFPAIDDIAMTLPFTRKEKDGNDSLAKEGIPGSTLLSAPTVYEKLREAKIPSFIFEQKNYAKSVYSKASHRGATTVTYIGMTDMLTNLIRKIESTKGSAYYLVYWADLDSIAHTYGPHTAQYQTELRTISRMIEEEFVNRLSPNTKKETVLMLTADHGQLTTDLRKTFYLSEHKDIMDLLDSRQNDDILLPWGSPRDVFLRAAEGRKEDLLERLQKLLKGRAIVRDTAEMMKEGLFGRGQMHPEWLQRLGDISILSTDTYTVWYESDRTERLFKPGQHGGMHVDEMIIPFIFAPLSEW